MGHRAKLQRVVGTLFIIIAFVLAPPVHGHREDDCYEALYTGQQIEACISAAAFKWNLNGSSSVEDSCCAIFEGLNCALNHSCTVCPPEDLSDWAQYRVRALTALSESLCATVPYGTLKEKCQIEEPIPPVVWHCSNEPVGTTKRSHDRSGIILALAMLALCILIAFTGLIVHLSLHESKEDEEKPQPKAKQQLPPAAAPGPSSESIKTDARSGSIGNIRYIPVISQGPKESDTVKSTQAECKTLPRANETKLPKVPSAPDSQSKPCLKTPINAPLKQLTTTSKIDSSPLPEVKASKSIIPFRKAPSTLLSVVNNNKKVASQKSGLEKTSLGLVRSKSPSKSTRRAKVKRSGDVQ